VTGHAETARQLVHVGMVAFALLLRVVTWWQAAMLAAAALAFNLVVLPRLAPSLFRAAERGGRAAGGIVFYPLSVLLLVVLFPRRLDIVAAAWALLACGDGAATLAGRRLRGPRLPWHPEKSWSGLAAFVVAGGSAGTLLAWWVRPAVDPQPSLAFALAAPWAAAVVAALVETLPVRLDDNLSVPAAGGATLWALSLVSADAVLAARPALEARLGPALLVNIAAAVPAVVLGAVSGAGAAAGIAVGLAVYLGTGVAGWVLLAASFIAAVATTRVGLGRKAVLGIAEGGGGRRGPGNAIANCGLAAAAALLSVAGAPPDLARLAVAAALTAGASDTVASEIGKAWGRTTVLVTSLARVPPGTPGALSLEGTLAGLVGAFALAALGAGLGLVPPSWVWIVAVAATAGGLVESVLGATFETAGIVNNDLLNFLNTAVAAAVAVLLARGVA
jgi:uncharacterized protein (TIGR00297 family)